MKLRHLVPAAALSAGLIAAAAPASAATTYTPSQGNGTTSASVIRAGGAVSFCGGGFRSGTSVAISVDGRGLRSVTASGGGGFCTAVRLFSIGRHVLRGTGAAGIVPSSFQQFGSANSLQIRSAVLDTSSGPALQVRSADLATLDAPALQIEPVAATRMRTVTVLVTVVGAGIAVNGSGTTSSGGLPFTGAGITLMVAVAAGLAGIGTAIRVMGRRRRHTVA